MRYEEEENAIEQNTKTYTNKSSQSLIEGIIRYKPLAGFTGRSAPVPPA